MAVDDEKPDISYRREGNLFLVDEKGYEAAKKAGKLLMIAHVLPFVPEYDFAYQKVQSGEYGRLLGGHFRRRARAERLGF
jgi:hypothetical protein